MGKFERFANFMVVYIALFVINGLIYSFFETWYKAHFQYFLIGTGVISLITFVVYIVIDERSHNNQ